MLRYGVETQKIQLEDYTHLYIHIVPFIHFGFLKLLFYDVKISLYCIINRFHCQYLLYINRANLYVNSYNILII